MDRYSQGFIDTYSHSLLMYSLHQLIRMDGFIQKILHLLPIKPDNQPRLWIVDRYTILSCLVRVFMTCTIWPDTGSVRYGMVPFG